MSVTRADLLSRLRHPTKAEASTQTTILLTGAACADMREAADKIERLEELLRGTGANRYWEGRWRDEAAKNEHLRATLSPFAEAAKKATISGAPVFNFVGANDFEQAARVLQQASSAPKADPTAEPPQYIEPWKRTFP